MIDFNKRILSILKDNARASYTEIGKKVGLTGPAVAERIRKMEEKGVIQGYQTLLNPEELGLHIHAIISLRAFVGKLKPLLRDVEDFPEVINCFRITGNENIMMEVRLRDQSHLESFIDMLITYGETRTHIVLSNVVSGRSMGI